MEVSYRILLDDPASGTNRIFIREAGDWPFPSLPAPGDAVGVDVPGGWDLMEPRRIKQVIYLPAQNKAYIDIPVEALDDPAPQIDLLLAAGFEEVGQQPKG
jgi:hypothetical protein